ncbi:flavin reductase family protein [Asticcacaulis sp. EMRT-3]|uniref:flavin reductase family protein n=1 Tax=Asticcacaulis sp. EMRT-3 TaxID=3040349 RepID=UPI0024AFDA46|nr:flavin reductase family protein [Asticcacaulis sp. EMRT-3]MDI7774385.1 flavin reductase family protein [Asticcacaulis sp. EMRT-3]
MDKKALRHTLGSFATGVCVITTPDPDHQAGHVIGMTANSFSSVSLEPPLVQWCLDLKAHRYQVYAEAPRFAINVLGAGQATLSRRFARQNAHILPEEGLVSPLHPLRLEGVAAFLDCELYDSRVMGDHLVITARVMAFDADTERAGLLFFRGRYGEAGVML